MKVDFARLDRGFNPHCIVVVGDSKEEDYRWLRSQSEFKGKLYSVQINPKSIEDIKTFKIENYTSLLDIPEPIDLAIIAVPRTAVLQIIEECIRKDVAVAHVYSAGFSETGTEEGIKLERLITKRAKEANLHLIGPNCMGIFNPKIAVMPGGELYSGIYGPVGFISHSGSYADNFGLEAHLQGVDINKSVSFGNGMVLDSTDYLEYFGQDPGIEVIGMYLEGVREGKRFLKVLKEVSSRKPVVVWKGGRTEEGGQAIASHTASLAVSHAVWDAAVKQCGALSVARMEELIDTLKALLYLSPIYGNRVAVAGTSGGQSVSITDVFTEVGLRIPSLTEESYDELATFFTLMGGSYRNPIDTGGNPKNRREMKRILEVLERDGNVDNLILMMRAKSGWCCPGDLQTYIKVITDIRMRTSKPVMAIVQFSTSGEMREAKEITRKLQDEGVAAFPSMERAALALKKALDYYSLRV